MRASVLFLLLLACAKAPAEPPYVRKESPAALQLYSPIVPYYETNPPQLARFIAVLQQRSGMPVAAAEYPADVESLRRAASAFHSAAKEVFGFELALERDDAAQFDRFFDAHLADTSDDTHVPLEPLFYYCAGAFWGEWLVRHREATWQLYPPVRPVQAFADFLVVSGTACILPFSQIVEKMSDPKGDPLAYAANPRIRQQQLPPFPLIASLADAEHAARMTLAPAVRDAKTADEFEKYFADATEASAREFALAAQTAWKTNEWTRFERWSIDAINHAPNNPALRYTLAAYYAGDPFKRARAILLLRQALQCDPEYVRAQVLLRKIDAFE